MQIRASKRGRFKVDYYYDHLDRLSTRKDNFGNITQFFYTNHQRPDEVSRDFIARFFLEIYGDFTLKVTSLDFLLVFYLHRYAERSENEARPNVLLLTVGNPDAAYFSEAVITLRSRHLIYAVVS